MCGVHDMLCATGHNICNTCKPKVTHCPFCRESIAGVRNLALEEMARQVKYPCTYRKYGCKDALPQDTIGELQDKCRYTPQTCPLVTSRSSSM
jgi:hypothetical protein